jgi:hypothetical protein
VILEIVLLAFTGIFIIEIFLHKDGCGNLVDLQPLGIVLGIIATIVGVLVPLHYSLVLDIIGNLFSGDCSKKSEGEDVYWLYNYISASDIIIYITALFGASSLMEGVFAIAVSLRIMSDEYFPLMNIGVAVIYLLLCAASIWRSWITREKQKQGKCAYIVTLFFLSIISAIWSIILITCSRQPGRIIATALIILCDFYVGWLLLKIPYIPIIRKRNILNN